MRINLPNQITLCRLGLAIVFFALLSWFNPNRLDEQRWLLQVCFWIFLVAALTDILDGFLARLTQSITSFGRIVDPVVDKVIVCGAFIFFASPHFWNVQQQNISSVAPWMAVVILVRELLVSAVRSHAESSGQEFGALWTGKLKMFIQSFTVCFILGQLAWDIGWLEPVRKACVWLTVIITAASAISYVHRARAFLLSTTALGGVPVAPSRTANIRDSAAAGGPAVGPADTTPGALAEASESRSGR